VLYFNIFAIISVADICTSFIWLWSVNRWLDIVPRSWSGIFSWRRSAHPGEGWPSLVAGSTLDCGQHVGNTPARWLDSFSGTVGVEN